MKKKVEHKDKVKLARKLRTKQELIDRVPIFQTKTWEARKKARALKEYETTKRKRKTKT